MKQLLVLEKKGKPIIELYGVEYELIFQKKEEERVKKNGKSK